MISANIQKIKQETGENVKLVAVTKTKSPEMILEAYNSGHKIFGENKVQELVDKYNQLPKDIEWHMIGHLQTNKVKYIAPFVSLIHSVDSLKLLDEIEKQAAKNKRMIAVLLQVFIAQEETKFGLDESELNDLMKHVNENPTKYQHVQIAGLMGIATNTDNETRIRNEFKKIKTLFDNFKLQTSNLPAEAMAYERQAGFKLLSIGMSHDYKIAIEEGSNMIRVGSLIFGERN
ncbi:MAG: YggS family pyridoxal phosphate-dependent enzyme [Bacteroidia bacterium]